MNDSWRSGAAYERFMGRWSTLVARKFFGWLAVPSGQRWVDVGCGTGSLTRGIVETQQPNEVIAVDASRFLIAHAQQSLTDQRVHFLVGLAQSLGIKSDSVDAVVSGLVLNFVPQPEQAVAEMLRVTKPGGTIGIFLWDYSEGMQMLRYFWDSAIMMDPAAREQDEGVRFPLCREGQLEALVRSSGLRQVQADALIVETTFHDFRDYWQPFLGAVGPAPNYTAKLPPKDRQKLEARLRQTLPFNPDGSITMSAKAWAVKGIVPISMN